MPKTRSTRRFRGCDGRRNHARGHGDHPRAIISFCAPILRGSLTSTIFCKQIRENGIDAVVVTRLSQVVKKAISIPSSTYVAPFPSYNSLYGYLGAVYPIMYDSDTSGKT